MMNKLADPEQQVKDINSHYDQLDDVFHILIELSNGNIMRLTFKPEQYEILRKKLQDSVLTRNQFRRSE